MAKKVSFKRQLFLFFSSAPFILRRWSIQKKLHVSLLTLIGILGFNALLTSYEVYRLKEHNLNLSYLIYLDFLGIIFGGLFIWVLSKSVIRRMKKMVEQIENRSFVEPLNTYSADEIGQLARAVSFMKKNHSNTGESLEEKNQLIEALLTHSNDSIILFNQEGVISSYSKSLQKKAGYPDEEMAQISLSELLPALKLHEVMSALSSQSHNEPHTQELLLHKGSQKKIRVECTISPLSASHKPCYVALVREIKPREKIKSFVTKRLPSFKK